MVFFTLKKLTSSTIDHSPTLIYAICCWPSESRTVVQRLVCIVFVSCFFNHLASCLYRWHSISSICTFVWSPSNPIRSGNSDLSITTLADMDCSAKSKMITTIVQNNLDNVWYCLNIKRYLGATCVCVSHCFVSALDCDLQWEKDLKTKDMIVTCIFHPKLMEWDEVPFDKIHVVTLATHTGWFF